MKNWYEKNIHTIVTELGTDIKQGLPQETVYEKQKTIGKNTFAAKKKTSLIKKILFQIKDVSVIVLLVATALSFLLSIHEGSGLLEPAVILSIVVLNIVLALTQEGKAEKALDALADLNAPTCVVLRDGIRKTMDTAELVPGDIVILEMGSVVPADARLVEATGLFSDESALTGESEPAEKDAALQLAGEVAVGDQHNMVFSGCVITAGHGIAVVTETGMHTKMGQIAGHLDGDELAKTPLQLRLDKLGKTISWIAIISALFLLAVGLRSGTAFGTMVMIAVSLAVAAVPETLSLIVTLSLTNGVQKMVKKNALIRKLPAVETLGSTSVICSDKTGTLTQNRMTVQKMWLCNGDVFDADSAFDEAQKQLLIISAMCSNASVETSQNGEKKYLGNATEVGIMRLFDQKGYSKSDMEAEYPKVAEIPFSSERKRMTVVLKAADNGYIVLTKGALDRLPLRKATTEENANIQHAHDCFAKQAMRVIGVAVKYVDNLPDNGCLEELEQDLKLIGLIGLIDPPRPEAAAAIAKAKKAGIRTVMITGDHAATAGAIAKDIGILNEGQKVMTGAQLAQISDEELCNTVQDYSVYARVSPEDKIRIVQAWQKNGEVVAMTGDGVNDAPALKAADVGIAMGKAGTEVAKNASDMILTDDNFATIIEAVSEGRNVYENIKKTIYFLLVCNLSEILIMLFAQMAGWGVLLTPVMLLLINLLGDGIPGLRLAREISDEDVMQRKPNKRDESFFDNGLLRQILRQMINCSIVSLIAFYIGAFVGVPGMVPPSLAVGQTMAFLTVGWTSILHIFHVRSSKSVFKTSLRNNKLLASSAAMMIFVFGLLAATPAGSIFGLSAISGSHWLIVFGMSLIPTMIRELFVIVDNHPSVMERRRLTRTKIQNNFH